MTHNMYWQQTRYLGGLLQEIGASTPAATAFSSYVLSGNLVHCMTNAALIPVMLEILLATGFEPSFHSTGSTEVKLWHQQEGALLELLKQCFR